MKVTPTEVVTDAAPVYPAVLDELIPSAWHPVEQYANNPTEADHSQLKHRLRPMRGLRTDTTAQVIIAGHAIAALLLIATLIVIFDNFATLLGVPPGSAGRRSGQPRSPSWL